MNRKSFVTLLLALIMLFACAAAVAEYDTHVTLTGTAYGLTAGTTYTDDPLYDYISEKFNLDWDPWIVENKSHNEKIRIWTSSDSMPDVALWRSINMAEYVSYVDQELIAPLPDGWKESYPHLAKAIATSGLEEKMTVDGKIYLIPHTVFANYVDMEVPVVHHCVYYRKDWAQQLGFDIGETITLDEFAAYNKACVENDMVGAGNTVGITDSARKLLTDMMMFSEAWYTKFTKQDGQYVWSMTTDGVKEVIQLLRDWYNAGIIHPDFYALEDTEGFSVFDAGIAASTIREASVQNLHDVYKQFEAANPGKSADDCIGLTLLADNDGTPYGYEVTNYWMATIMGPNIDPEAQDRFLSLVDWMCDPKEGQLIVPLGLPGTDWEFAEDGSLIIHNKASYPSQKLFQMHGMCSDEANFLNPANDQDKVAKVLRNYEIRNAEGSYILRIDYDYDFYTSDLKSNYSVDVQSAVVEMIVSDEDLDTMISKFVEENRPLWEPLCEEINEELCK